MGFQFDPRCVPQWVVEEIEVIPLGWGEEEESPQVPQDL
jgi:hypothetical protein